MNAQGSGGEAGANESAALADIRNLVAEHTGLAVLEERTLDLSEAVYRRVEALGLGSAAGYLQRLAGPHEKREELLALAQSLTIGETYFFRYPQQLRALVEVALPGCLRAQSGTTPVRILSAGCSTGEEPYTVAMLLRMHFPTEVSRRVEIRACDLNALSIGQAITGRYGRWALRETTDAARLQFFDVDGPDFILRSEVRHMVAFEQRNLATEDEWFWHTGAFDIIFFRNVSIYFTPPAARAILAQMTRALRPGGYLFLGHSETMKGQSTSLDLRHTHDAFYFQSRGPGAPTLVKDRPAVPVSPRSDPASVPAAEEAILDSGRLLALIQLQQSAEALRLIEASSAADRGSPEVQRMLAVILLNGGNLAGARSICERLLTADSLDASAHYQLAICLEQDGDRPGAAVEDGMASHLDPRFAMPQMHLGLMARRAGDREGAVAALERALELLPFEDIARIMLYGGGFNREVLIRLCRSELRACGSST